MHGYDTARDEFTVLSDAEVPRLYPHHVVKHELQVQASFYTHLEQKTEVSAGLFNWYYWVDWTLAFPLKRQGPENRTYSAGNPVFQVGTICL